jgi:hypothetical protein
MDLTRLSDADLFALKAGDLSKMSDEGLISLKGGAAPQATAKPEMSWGDVASGAATNFIPSAINVGKSVVEAVSSPLQTAKGLIDVGAGALQNVLPERLVQAIGEDKESRQKASAVADFYKQRYGSMEGFKEALATDPAGVMADASTVLTGGGALAAKAPMMAKVGQAATRTGAAIDPLVLALRGTGKAAELTGKGIGSIATKYAGLASGVGDEPLKQAYQAGKAGGAQGASFIENMRGQVPMQDVLETAKADLAAMGQQKQAAYRQDMQSIRGDKTVLDFSDIDNALSQAAGRTQFKGQVIKQGAANKVQEARELVDNWKNLDPAQYHTPEGLDALKQQVGDILESIPFEQKNARASVGEVYNAIKSTIGNQAPQYAKVMKDYAEASDTIKQIEQALSLGKKSSVDTGMRKLQSLMRNNVNTNYGNRLKLAQALEEAGGQQIMPALAGQALNEWTPRGMQRAAAIPTSVLAGLANPVAGAANLMASSPRLMGETAYKAGQLAGGLRRVRNLPSSMLSPNQAQMLQNIDPRVIANVLYQMNQPKEQQ